MRNTVGVAWKAHLDLLATYTHCYMICIYANKTQYTPLADCMALLTASSADCLLPAESVKVYYMWEKNDTGCSVVIRLQKQKQY